MQTLYSISVFIHILCAIVWIGGMLFLTMVVVPVTRQPDFQGIAGRFFNETGNKFRRIGWACFILLFITGFLNLTGRFGSMAVMGDSEFWMGPFGSKLAMKITLFALILIMSAIHDFFVGPRAAQLLMDNPDNPAAAKVRKSASWFGRVNMLLGLIVVFLAVGMIRGM